MDPVKFVACQAYSISQYRNIRTKIMKCCANIYFNQQYLIKPYLINNIFIFKIIVVFIDGQL